MNKRWILGLGIPAVVVMAVVWLTPRKSKEEGALEATEAALRQQGFKVSLEDFKSSAPGDELARGSALTNLGRYAYAGQGFSLFAGQLMFKAGSNSALVIWSTNEIPAINDENFWIFTRQMLSSCNSELDGVAQEVLAGRFGFAVNTNADPEMGLQRSQLLMDAAAALGYRAILELHDGNRDAAWTNLLAATRMVTAGDTEPMETAQRARIAETVQAVGFTWQVLQAGGWSDERLAELQKEWESLDFFSQLPETEAFTGANLVAVSDLDRQQPLRRGLVWETIITEPSFAWKVDKLYRAKQVYRKHGTFEDEKDILLFYRDREVEMRRALSSKNWQDMRVLAAATVGTYPSKHQAPAEWPTLAKTRQLNALLNKQVMGLAEAAAEGETWRRLAVTAIAVERYRERHGEYPTTLAALVPELLKSVPDDFMDGEPLRYRATSDGRFLLYSVGLNHMDQAGELSLVQRTREVYLSIRAGTVVYGTASGTGGPVSRSMVMAPPVVDRGMNLVWPMAASSAEVQTASETGSWLYKPPNTPPKTETGKGL